MGRFNEICANERGHSIRRNLRHEHVIKDFSLEEDPVSGQPVVYVDVRPYKALIRGAHVMATTKRRTKRGNRGTPTNQSNVIKRSNPLWTAET